MDVPVARNIKVVIAYDGSAYHGWQRQAGGLPTIQETLEKAILRVVNHPVHLHGSGRTDAGVHAAGQVANFLTDATLPADGLRRALNSRLPGDITIRRCEDMPLDFHAIGQAISKLYRYTIYHHVDPPPPALAGRCRHWFRDLSIEPMREAAKRLVGRHDFAAFQSSGSKRMTTVRTLGRLEIARDFRCIHFDIAADGFLYNMVRNLVGTLGEVGRGHWPPAKVGEILAAKQRCEAGPTAPAHGLCLMWVQYPPRPPAANRAAPMPRGEG